MSFYGNVNIKNKFFNFIYKNNSSKIGTIKQPLDQEEPIDLTFDTDEWLSYSQPEEDNYTIKLSHNKPNSNNAEDYYFEPSAYFKQEPPVEGDPENLPFTYTFIPLTYKIDNKGHVVDIIRKTDGIQQTSPKLLSLESLTPVVFQEVSKAISTLANYSIGCFIYDINEPIVEQIIPIDSFNGYISIADLEENVDYNIEDVLPEISLDQIKIGQIYFNLMSVEAPYYYQISAITITTNEKKVKFIRYEN